MSEICWQYKKGSPHRGEHAWREWESYTTPSRWQWEECRHCGGMRNVSSERAFVR